MSQQQPATAAAPGAFEHLRSHNIDSLNIRVEHYRHRDTGAEHYHLAADNSENVFLVALRTVPMDSTGVAHILEHTALCGSERYPVRDPFFMMLRRSLNTFMNAFTSSDWTAYPFASQNRKDFANLLDVYLDAVFFSRLDPLDFAQEGHRLDFAEPGNLDSALVHKGVVYNEMKGAMSSINSVLWQSLCEQLFPTNTYHYNSGGDPAHIPELSYEQLRAFYQTHYHPGNAIFMTYGDIPAAEHQAVFQQRVLSRFDASGSPRIEVALERRLPAPRRVVLPYALDDGEDTGRKTHIVTGWLLGQSTDLEAQLEAELLTSVLLDNSASPLLHALETTPLGQSPSSLCGLEDSQREMVFSCGITGSEAENADAFEALVLEVIQRVAEEGVAQEQLEAVLHQLELHQREVSGDGFPYGLQLIMQALGPATHYADPVAVLDLEPVLDTLRERIAQPGYIQSLARRLLLDNPHRVTLVMTPDTGLSARRESEERERLETLKAGMDTPALRAIAEQAERLDARQQQVDDLSILPKVTLADVAPTLPRLDYSTRGVAGLPLTAYARGTNGLVYQQLIAELPALADADLELLPLYTRLLTETGLGDADYLSVQHRQSATVGSISAWTSARGGVDDEQQVSAHLVLSSKALGRLSQEQVTLMRDTLLEARFDERARLRELVSQQRARREQAVTGQGHALAMTAACAGMSPLGRLHHEQGGLEGLRRLKALDDSLDDDSRLEAFAASLGDLHRRLARAPRQVLTIADEPHLDSAVDSALAQWQTLPTEDANAYHGTPLREVRREIWLANTQGNFCATAFPTVPVGHPDAAALTVLGGFLRNGFLHRSIREQGGAYGGGASQDSGVAAFRFFSYRDPRLQATLEDFQASIHWLQHHQHSPESLEEAVLGVISSLDKPGSPAGEARQDFHNRLYGRDHAQREAFRRAVLSVTLEDLLRVADTWLKPERASTAVVTSRKQLESLGSWVSEQGLEIREL
ncbi:MAG: peptidase M16 [Haliea sp.]|nr:peptidase M16 [Haliea sp.]